MFSFLWIKQLTRWILLYSPLALSLPSVHTISTRLIHQPPHHLFFLRFLTLHCLFLFHLLPVFFSYILGLYYLYPRIICTSKTESVNCSVVSDSLRPHETLPGSFVPGILQARILEWVAIPLLQGIFPTQGSSPVLLNCRQIIYHLSHKWHQQKLAFIMKTDFGLGAAHSEVKAGVKTWLRCS